VRRFATTQETPDPNVDPRTQLDQRAAMKPIDRAVFNKMLFCDEVFRFINLEETLYFTHLDIALNSFTKGETVDEEKLLRLNRKLLTDTFTFNFMQPLGGNPARLFD